MNESASLFVTNPDPDSMPLEYRRGWLLQGASQNDAPSSWIALSLGLQRRLVVHPGTQVTRYEDQNVVVVLIGLPVDLDLGSIDAADIGREIAQKIVEDPSSDEALLKYVAYLGGRFVCLTLTKSDGDLSILTDCTATHPVYWAHTTEVGFVASQHASLTARAAGLDVDEPSKALILKAREMGTGGTLFPPGTMTGYQDVMQVLPNHVLRVRRSGVSHERYYPFSDTSLPSDGEEAYQSFRSSFVKHVRLLSGLGPVGVSLTGGRDSRATLAALLPYLDENSVTWTYFNSENPHPVHVADLESARDLAARLGVRHVEVDLVGPRRDAFVKAHKETMGATAQMASVPLAYDTQLPHDLIEFQSMAAEVGTGFYRKRSGKPTAPRLAELYSRTPFGRLPLVLEELEKFIDYADFSEDSFGDLDFHDFYYWEHRLGRWGSRRIQEVDLAHNVVLPFNSRAIIESLMSKPADERGDKQDLVRFVDEMSPVLAR